MTTLVLSESEDKRTLRLYYDSSATTYDSVYRDEQEAKYRAWFTHRDLTSFQCVLDLGCGTGLFPSFARIHRLRAPIVCVDLSEEMLKIADARFSVDDEVYLVCADAEHLPFQQASFDLVVAFTVVHLLADPYLCLRELKTVITTNALVVITWLRKKCDVEAVKTLLRQAEISHAELLENQSQDLITTITS